MEIHKYTNTQTNNTAGGSITGLREHTEQMQKYKYKHKYTNTQTNNTVGRSITGSREPTEQKMEIQKYKYKCNNTNIPIHK